MKHAEEHETLNPRLYGSHKGRCALDPVQQEILQYDIYKYSMKSGITKDLDAASCYDRIFACIASIASKGHGLSPNAAHLNTISLRDTQFRIKTSLGILEGTYQHTDEEPIHGTGQGPGNLPMIWTFISSALFDTFQHHAHGSTFESHDGKIKVQKYMTGFVDDSSMGVNLFCNHQQPNVATLTMMMTSDAQLWCNLLWASGGRLELNKCMTYHIRTSRTHQGSHFTLDPNLPHVTLRDPYNGDEIPIQIIQHANAIALSEYM